MTLKPWCAAGMSLGLSAIGAGPVAAHHSFSMFDSSKTVTLEGSVRAFQWTNPHVWVQLLVKDAAGKEVEWSIEGSGSTALSRKGWTRQTMKPGDRAVIAIHPLKDGSDGGSLVSALVNGQPVGASD